MRLQFFQDFYEFSGDDAVAFVGGVEAVVGDADRFGGIGVFVLCGIEGNVRVIGVGIVVITAGLRVLQSFEPDEPRHGQAFCMVEVDHFYFFVPSDGADGFCDLFQ